MKYISLFAGIGGFDLALNRLGHECVWANEWDKYAGQIYDKNLSERGYPGRLWDKREEWDTGKYSEECPYGIDTRDIRTVPTSEIPEHDLLVGGFPCQAFSIAGKRKGFDDTRGTLFFEIARILRDKRPRYFILENVKGLLSHDSGKTFATILGVLTDLGYDFQWQVLNSKNFGVPQNRERVFIVGHIRGQPRPQVFPITVSNGTNSDLVYYQKADREIARVYDTKGIAPTLHLKTGGWQEPKIAVERTPLKFLRRNQKRIEGDYSFTVDGANTGGVKISNTVRSSGRGSYGKKQNWDSFEFGGRIRRLTPTECERLQGFPDGWTEGVSDTQRYKCLGNAVTVNVVYEVAKRLTCDSNL